MADRTREELDGCLDGLEAYIFESDIAEMTYNLEARRIFLELKDSVREDEDTDSNPK
ncbi:hypothetical protein A2U01_0066958, partial [Trifolium medium]|nr:hypothetical protein [Trifolium medium]